MIDAVLVERTVGEVVPSLKATLDMVRLLLPQSSDLFVQSLLNMHINS